MTRSTLTLLQTTHRPSTVDELSELVQGACRDLTPLYPIGGGTSLDFGLPLTRPGDGVELTGLNRVIDYPAADMTITVQAGIRMAELDRILGEHQQQLPLDVPSAAEATLGGVLATNASGARRLAYGTARDYVIGIRAIDGRGTAFAGGGRVVKNVAGYDFCKLLIGSLGTLGITTEVTLKLKPRPPMQRVLVAAPRDLAQLQTVLAELVQSRAQPTGVEWLGGPDWDAWAADHDWPASKPPVGWLVVLLEGLAEEVAWMTEQLQTQWRQSSSLEAVSLAAGPTEACLHALTEFPAGQAALALKANVRPSETIDLVRLIVSDEADVSFQAHAANGVVNFRFPRFPATGISQTVASRWQPAAAKTGGNLIIVANREGQEMTRRAVWGTPSGPLDLMRRIKAAFDPHDILNPGRFVY